MRYAQSENDDRLEIAIVISGVQGSRKTAIAKLLHAVLRAAFGSSHRFTICTTNEAFPWRQGDLHEEPAE